jgi:hypothetical protein
MTYHRLALQLVAAVVALPLLYLISSGPALRIAKLVPDDRTTFAHTLHFYRPLFRLAWVVGLDQPMRAYLRLCGLRTVTITGRTQVAPYGGLSVF